MPADALDAQAAQRQYDRIGRVFVVRSNLAEQNQDQQDDDHETESAAAVIAGAVERTAADSTEDAEQRNDQDDQDDGSKGHGQFTSLGRPAREVRQSASDQPR